MTPDELTEAAWACRKRWSSWASIVKRALDPHTNLATPFRFAIVLRLQPALPPGGLQEAGHAPGDSMSAAIRLRIPLGDAGRRA